VLLEAAILEARRTTPSQQHAVVLQHGGLVDRMIRVKQTAAGEPLCSSCSFDSRCEPEEGRTGTQVASIVLQVLCV
jgi:hypothetical protein